MTPKQNQFGRKLFSWLLFSLVVFGLFVFFRADEGKKFPLIGWFSKSSLPELGILALSILTSSILWMIISKGVLSEISIFNTKINLNMPKFRNIISIPSPLLTIFSTLSLAFLLFMPPECVSPNIVFQINLGEETKEYTPQSNIDVGLLSSVIVTIKSEETLEDMECTFQANGDGLERFNSSSKSCSTTVFFKDKPSIIVLAVNLEKKFCNNSTNFSITLKHQ